MFACCTVLWICGRLCACGREKPVPARPERVLICVFTYALVFKNTTPRVQPIKSSHAFTNEKAEASPSADKNPGRWWKRAGCGF